MQQAQNDPCIDEASTDAPPMQGAMAVVNTLIAHGVKQVFGYPGGAIMPVYDALYDGGVQHVLARHEQGAGFAALGFARASGQTGVCLATSGPGATNLITVLADAMMDSIPLVAITGQVPTTLIGTDAFQEIDLLGMSLSCTKHSFLVSDIEDLVPTLYRAFEIAASDRPGPVLVDIPKDIQLATIAAQFPAPQLPRTRSPDFIKLQQAKQLLQQAQRPMLYVGGGVALAQAVPALRAFISCTQMPSVCTLKALGSVLPDEPLYLGMLGMHGLKAANLAVQECDLLLVVGARFDDRVTGKLDSFAPDAKVIHLDIDPAEFGKLRRPDIAIDGELSEALNALSSPLAIEPWLVHIGQLKLQHQWRYQWHQPMARAIDAPALLRELSEQLSPQAVITCDVGQHQMWVAQHMQFHSPESHLSSSGLGTMGYGLPTAIGAKFARIEEQVIAVCGDGSFMMNVQELSTIKRMGIPVKILLLDNQKLGMVKQWQQLFFDGRLSETDLSDNPEFVTLAAAFDIEGEAISSADQVADALQRLLSAKGAYLLHVRLDQRQNVWPLVPPGAANNQMLEQEPHT